MEELKTRSVQERSAAGHGFESSAVVRESHRGATRWILNEADP